MEKTTTYIVEAVVGNENQVTQGANEQKFAPPQQHNILHSILDEIEEIDFREKAGLKGEEKLETRHYLIVSIEEVLSVAIKNKWGLCKKDNFLMVFNGAFWQSIDRAELEDFLGKATEKMGVDKNLSRYYSFREHLFKQFLSSAKLTKLQDDDKSVKINLLNGTFEIIGETQILRLVDRRDFLTYQLPFNYDPQSKATLFTKYLDRVLPDVERQMVLAEYIGYLFVKAQTLKLEKVLMLFGGGANGKSVLFEIVNALLGKENVSNFSLQNLTNENGYYRAKIANKLVNYASEINNKLSTDVFKQLASGEPIEARLPYGEPFIITDYAKLIFNCNDLPRDIEQTNAFFRRFLIIPFDVTIPEGEQDKELAKKIIDKEMSGVFNWVLEGLNRLLTQKALSKCDAIEKQLESYKLQSDSVRMFIDDHNYESCVSQYTALKDMYTAYREFCNASGYRVCNIRSFSERLKNIGFEFERKNQGNVVYAKKKVVLEITSATQPTPLL